MVKYSSGSLDATFAALADPGRRAIVDRLANEGEASVSELARPLGMSLQALGKHLRVLEHAGLVRHEKQGRVRRCWVVPGRLRRARDWLDRYRIFWEGQLGALAAYLEEQAHGAQARD
jgi:DNA-binding transcriptional ArsR family regulator